MLTVDYEEITREETPEEFWPDSNIEAEVEAIEEGRSIFWSMSGPCGFGC